MRRHLANAGFGVLDYLSYPTGMLLVAPIVLHRLGPGEYGLWMIATAVISSGGIIASGFCDACIQRVAFLRGRGEFKRITPTVRSMLGIHVVLGLTLVLSVWIGAPYAAKQIAKSQTTSVQECLLSLRIASIAIFLRAMESMGVGVQRAFEQYRQTVQISASVRLLTLGSAALLAMFERGTVSILIATAAFLFCGAWVQLRTARKLVANASLWPSFHPRETRVLFNLGKFAWLQALSGLVFGQFDRILLGLSLGAVAVAPYALCVQFAHPIFGLSAAGLNFLFPYLSSRTGTASIKEIKHIVLKAFACNLITVVICAGALLIFGNQILRIWAGTVVAASAKHLLLPIVLGSALMGLSVTGTYAMQALGHFSMVAYIGLISRTAMLLLMFELLHRQGLQGLAFSRLLYGAIALLVYLPLLRQLWPSRPEHVSSLAIQLGVQGETNQ